MTRRDFSQLNIQDAFPEFAQQAHGWNPADTPVKMKIKFDWICPKGHIFAATLSDLERGQGCAVCASKRIQVGYNDLATLYPEIAAQADGWDPKTVMPRSNKKFDWKCSLGHKWNANVLNRTFRNGGCPICSGKQTLVGFNDLSTTDPEIADQADGWNPRDFTRASNKKVLWKCKLGHNWETSIGLRTLQKTGCPVCSGHTVVSGVNDLATLYPDVASQADGWVPEIYSPGSHHKLSWKCEAGHTWSATITSRIRLATGCPICANKRVLAGYNDLATTHPEIASQADGWDPSTVIGGSNKKFLWKCSEGHSWEATSMKRLAGRGCPICAKTGFNPEKEAWVYMLRQELWGLLQIGITNVPKDRLAVHRKLNWEVLDLRGPMKGSEAYLLEQELLRFLKIKKADFSVEKIAGKFTGYTESWIENSCRYSSLNELINEFRDSK